MSNLIPECLTTTVRLSEMQRPSSSFSSEILDMYVQLINLSSRHILSRIRRDSLKYKTVSNELHSGEKCSYILTNYQPVISISSLYDDTEHDFGAATLIKGSKYHIANANIGKIQLYSGQFTDGISNVKVSYVSGYSSFFVSSYNIVFNDGGSNITATVSSGRYNANELGTAVKNALFTNGTEQEDESSQDTGSYDASSDNNRVTLSSGSMTPDAYIGYTFTFDATSGSIEQGNSYKITDNGSDWIEIDTTLSGLETVSEWNIKATYTVTYSEVTHKYTISSSHSSFELVWSSCSRIAYILGYDSSANDTGSTSYTADYPALGIPADLVGACTGLVRWLHAEVSQNDIGMLSVEGRGSVDFSNVPKWVDDIILSYRRLTG